jgi:hypothetical protein
MSLFKEATVCPVRADITSKLKYFSGINQTTLWALTELIDTLQDDLYLQQGSEREHYTDHDRETMSNKIADITLIRDARVIRAATREELIAKPIDWGVGDEATGEGTL